MYVRLNGLNKVKNTSISKTVSKFVQLALFIKDGIPLHFHRKLLLRVLAHFYIQ